METLILQTEVFSLVTNGVASYVPYVRALCYAIAGVICVIGSLYVYIGYIQQSPQLQARVLKLVFSCVFLVLSAHALPSFFGLDAGDISGGTASGSGNSSSDGVTRRGTDISGSGNYSVSLPYGGNAIIWDLNGRYKQLSYK